MPKKDPPEISREHRRVLWIVALTLFLDLAGFGIILPVLPYYAESYGASPAVVTLLATAFSLAQFAMAPVLGRLSDEKGRRPVMLVSIAGGVAASLVLGFAGALWMIFVARLVSGASKANVSTAQACVADIVPKHLRAKYMGLMGAALGAGFIFGPSIGGLLSTEAMPTLPFFVSAGLGAVNWVLALIWLPETRHHAEGGTEKPRPHFTEQLGALFKGIGKSTVGLLILINFFVYVAFSAMESTFALFTEAAFEWQARETGFYLTFIGFMMVFTQGLLVGRLVKAMGEVKTMMLGLLSQSIGFALIGGGETILDWLGLQASHGASLPAIVVLCIGGFFLAGGNGTLNATLGALVSLAAPEDEQGYSMGLKESAGSLARITGPLVAGPLFQFIAPAVPFMFAALVGAGNLLLANKIKNKLKSDSPGGTGSRPRDGAVADPET